MKTWAIQQAKNRLSEIIARSIDQGPQVLTKRGVETAVVISMEEYRRLVRPENDLVAFFGDSPLADVEIDLTRSKDAGREINF